MAYKWILKLKLLFRKKPLRKKPVVPQSKPNDLDLLHLVPTSVPLLYEMGILESNVNAFTNHFPMATGPALYPSLPDHQKGTVLHPYIS